MFKTKVSIVIFEEKKKKQKEKKGKGRGKSRRRKSITWINIFASKIYIHLHLLRWVLVSIINLEIFMQVESGFKGLCVIA